jgi:hypothetical protein
MTVSLLVGLLNLALGLTYTAYGVITWLDLQRGWRGRGPSHFGLAWLAMAFTCGPHHVDHGLHVLTTHTVGGGLDLAAVLIGLPAGVTWFLLRVEAFTGGRGDRALGEMPTWVEALPTVAAMYLAALATAVLVALQAGGAAWDARFTANLLLVGLYMAIGAVLLRTQLHNHRITGGWSLSGLSLTIVFPTCALMHGVWIVYGARGDYPVDTHLLVIDALAVPAAAYFLWVVWSLSSGRMVDWNSGAADATGSVDEREAITAV